MPTLAGGLVGRLAPGLAQAWIRLITKKPALQLRGTRLLAVGFAKVIASSS